MAFTVTTAVVTSTADDYVGNTPAMYITNLDSITPVYVGSANTVTVSTGYPVQPLTTLRFDVTDTETVWLVSNGSAVVKILTYEAAA